MIQYDYKFDITIAYVITSLTYPTTFSLQKDDEGLCEFYNSYFTYPLYRDENLEFYKAFGQGTIFKGMSWNPITLYRGLKTVQKRMKEKGIAGNMAGEGVKTGGIIIFGTDGQPKYMYAEETGRELVMDDIKAALQAMRESQTEPPEL